MLGLALYDGGLGGAQRCGAALRRDGLSYEIGARLRSRRLRQRRAEHERDGDHANTPHDFLPISGGILPAPCNISLADFAEAGGLVSYGASIADAYRQVGVYTGRI